MAAHSGEIAESVNSPALLMSLPDAIFPQAGGHVDGTKS
jgi:hypothetical protein